ncbi:DinB family protein [Sphingobacterium sp. N143]|uniref:DinB family protein n=1 Tax=Sphingobacterium sp. N143 TaxID=2746727 RepID=UPI00257591C4|nr:DinB family protein [Sphingobacterium sp. N143]MDM1296560.1 DinB family protein [Sphingobacterium sp. N143]
MSIKKSYLIELDHETKNTKRILDRIPDEKLDWRPHEKSMSLGELAAHVVELHNWVSKAIPKEVFDFKVDYQPLKVSSVAELKRVLSDGVEANKVAIESLSDEDWFKDWVLKSGDYEISRLPRAGAIRFIINNHIVHHRGQLTVYLRLLDIAVPGLYGPSADEKWPF